MKTGVLLVNLGTPAAPTARAIRSWLREFLSDPLVVDLPRALWLPLLYGAILPLRPVKLVPAYASIWSAEGSPLLAISRRQRAALQQALPENPVALAMRYGEPSIDQGVAELQAQGADHIVVLPLYPQYSATTTGSVEAALRRREATLKLQTVHDYHAHPLYIAALANGVRTHWRQNGRGEHLLLSFHGLPQKFVDRGDPYASQCETTARLLAGALQLADNEWTLAYQSRVGRGTWLRPYTDDVLTSLARRGIRQLDAICPGFSADCLETLEEVAQRYAEQFTAASGGALRYVPALNAGEDHIALLRALVEDAIAGK